MMSQKMCQSPVVRRHSSDQRQQRIDDSIQEGKSCPGTMDVIMEQEIHVVQQKPDAESGQHSANPIGKTDDCGNQQHR